MSGPKPEKGTQSPIPNWRQIGSSLITKKVNFEMPTMVKKSKEFFRVEWPSLHTFFHAESCHGLPATVGEGFV